MTSTKSQSPFQNVFQFAVIFLTVYLLMQLVMGWFFPNQTKNREKREGVVISMVDATVKGGHHPEVMIANYTDAPLLLENRCPKPPVDIFFMQEGATKAEKVTASSKVDCTNVKPIPAIEPGKKLKVSLVPWKYSHVSQYGKYILKMPTDESVSTTFTLYEPNFITQIFRTFVTKPLLNFLIFIASIIPHHNLGVSIIILTLIVKLALFFPTQHALEGQKKLQAIQPKIEDIRKKHKDDPAKLNQETLALWKREKVNPMQSCLPMLIQFPVLIGLFFVIRDGSYLEYSRHLVYGIYTDIPWTWGTNFFGLNILEPNRYIMPPLLVALQFFQMKLSFAIAKKKKAEAESIVDVTPKNKKKKDEAPEQASMQETQQKVMMYGLPFMIGFFALKFPLAVSLYWAVSTLFAIGQQLVVNRKVTVS